MKYKVGTRGSMLALKQTEFVIDKLKNAYPEDSFEIVVMSTTGDKNQTSPIESIGTKGVFVDTIEKALLLDEIQLAVHSMKDMPDSPQEGLIFAKSWKREDPRDVLIIKDAMSLLELPAGSRIATGSKRREFQIKKMRPDLEIVPIRGNVDTRIKKLYASSPDNAVDAIVLAAAGIHRLGRANEITQYFSVDEMIPAPAQGTLALELRGDNTELMDKVNMLSDEVSENITYLERGILKSLATSCHDPIGAYASFEHGRYTLRACFGTEDGSVFVTAKKDSVNADERLIHSVVDEIRKQI